MIIATQRQLERPNTATRIENLLTAGLAGEALSGVESLAEVVGVTEVTLEAGALHEVALVPRKRFESVVGK